MGVGGWLQDSSGHLRSAWVHGRGTAKGDVPLPTGTGHVARWGAVADCRHSQQPNPLLWRMRERAMPVWQLARRLRRDLHGQMRAMHEKHQLYRYQGSGSFQPGHVQMGVFSGPLAI